MKGLTNTLGLIFRLSMTAAALLLTQQAFAAGADTNAGTVIENQATVSYQVLGVGQPDIPSSPVAGGAAGPTIFLVDRRVDFTLTSDGATADVANGATGVPFVYTLTNTSNSVMDFAISFRQMDGTDLDVNGNPDSADVSNPALDIVFVNDLAEDASVDITFTGEAAAALANGAVANIEVTATAMDPGGTAAAPVALADTSASPNAALVIDNVLADDAADGVGVEKAEDGFRVQAATLQITKTAAVISDPINGVSANAKAIPGAVIEYTIRIDNTAGAVGATGISIDDVIDSDVLFFNAANDPAGPPGAEPYDSGNANVSVGAVGFCLADASAADGCTFDSGTGTLTIAGSTLVGLTPITIGFGVGATLDIKFQVVVP